jgi:hypothetical protein
MAVKSLSLPHRLTGGGWEGGGGGGEKPKSFQLLRLFLVVHLVLKYSFLIFKSPLMPEIRENDCHQHLPEDDVYRNSFE